MADEKAAKGTTERILQDGFVGGGKIVCNGKEHTMIREDEKFREEMGCPRETPLGPCRCPKRP